MENYFYQFSRLMNALLGGLILHTVMAERILLGKTVVFTRRKRFSFILTDLKMNLKSNFSDTQIRDS